MPGPADGTSGAHSTPARPGLPRPADEHPSESSLDTWDDWDHVVVSEGTVEDLHRDALQFARDIGALGEHEHLAALVETR